jgi:hypothetical protein
VYSILLINASMNMAVLKLLKTILRRIRMYPNFVSNFIIVWKKSKTYKYKSTHKILAVK